MHVLHFIFKTNKQTISAHFKALLASSSGGKMLFTPGSWEGISDPSRLSGTNLALAFTHLPRHNKGSKGRAFLIPEMPPVCPSVPYCAHDIRTTFHPPNIPHTLSGLCFLLSSWLNINPVALSSMHLQQNLPLFHAVGYTCLLLHSHLPYLPCTVAVRCSTSLLYWNVESVRSGQCLDVWFVFIMPLPAQEALHTVSD